MLSLVFSSLGEEMKFKTDFLKVDIDESESLTRRFKVNTVPTVIIFENGQEMDRFYT